MPFFTAYLRLALEHPERTIKTSELSVRVKGDSCLIDPSIVSYNLSILYPENNQIDSFVDKINKMFIVKVANLQDHNLINPPSN